MKKYLAFTFLLLLASLVQAQKNVSDKVNGQLGPTEYHQFILGNGLKVIHLKNDKTKDLHLRIFTNTPMMNEGNTTGLKTMSLMLPLWSKVDNKTTVNALKSFGGNIKIQGNHYLASAPLKNKDQCLSIISSAIQKPNVTDVDFEEIKSFCQKRVELEQQNEDSRFNQTIFKIIYKKYPFGEIMDSASISRISQKMVIGHHKKYFLPNITFIAIESNMSHKKAQEIIEKYFGNWEKITLFKEYIPKPKPITTTQWGFIVDTDAQVPKASIAHSIFLHPVRANTYRADILNEIIALRMKKAGLNDLLTDNMAFEKNRDLGNFGISFRGKSPKDIAAAVTKTLDILKALQSEPVSEKELSLAKKNLYAKRTAALHEINSRLKLGINIMRFKRYDKFYNNVKENYEEITPEDLHNFAVQLIQPQKMYILFSGKPEDQNELQNQPDIPQLAKYNLDGSRMEKFNIRD